ncbi:MAG: RecX family transcriptional regulator [Erythrobacter sp.]|jgi:regulatory protein|nr:RecX family transcriptional regulator [Erythrobacter sp.]
MVSRESKTSRDRHAGSGQKRARPLDGATLRDLALSYVARFGTTAAKLEAYLARKIRERGVAEDADGRTETLDIAGLVSDFVEAGYVDDAAYAKARSRDLTARGYGGRRVEQALWAAGVAEVTRSEYAPGEGAARRAAAVLARKRRFGPYGAPVQGDPLAARKRREKHVAAMLRAGHPYEHAAFICDASDPAQVDAWADEVDDREEGEEHTGW